MSRVERGWRVSEGQVLGLQLGLSEGQQPHAAGQQPTLIFRRELEPRLSFRISYKRDIDAETVTRTVAPISTE